jgi:hypothetical protein
MTRNLKALGLALVAVFALGAVMASGASAHEFTSTSEKTILTGTSELERGFVIHTNGPESTPAIECHADYEGTIEGKAVSSVTVTPTISNCNNVLGQAVTVTTNHCAFILEGATTGEHAVSKLECAAFDSAHPTTNKIVMKFGTACTLEFGEQVPKKGSRYTATTVGGFGHVTVNVTVEGFVFTKTGPLCAGVPGNGTNGVFTDQVTVKGYEDKKSIGEGTAKTTPVMAETEGNQVSIGLK